MEKKYLKDIAYEQLKEMILLGEINGPIITEQQLVDMLNISRTPIRDALQRIDNNDNLSEILPKRGILIKELSVKETIDLMDLRLAIELFSFSKIRYSLNEHHLEVLDKLVKEQQVFINKNEISNFIKSDIEYHKVFIGIYDNDHFLKVLDNITDRIFLHGIKIFTKNPERLEESYNDHILLNNYIRKKELDKAERMLETHIGKGKSLYLS